MNVSLDISGYRLVRADYLANGERGGVCIYFPKSFPLRLLDIFFLHKCINFEMRTGDKECNFISLYTSLNQSLEEFESFADNLESLTWIQLQKTILFYSPSW